MSHHRRNIDISMQDRRCIKTPLKLSEDYFAYYNWAVGKEAEQKG